MRELSGLRCWACQLLFSQSEPIFLFSFFLFEMYGQGQFLNRRMNMNQMNKLQRDLHDDDDDDDLVAFTKAKVDDDDDKFRGKELDFGDMFKPKPSPQRAQPPPAKPQTTPKKEEKPQPPPKKEATPNKEEKPQPTPKKEEKPQTPIKTPVKIEPPKYRESLKIPPTPPPFTEKPKEVKQSTVERKPDPKKDVSPKKAAFAVPEDTQKIDNFARPSFVRKGKADTVSSVLAAFDPSNDKIRVIEPKNLKVVSRSLMMKESPAYYGANGDQFEDFLFPANQSQLYQVPWRAKIDAKSLQFSRAASYYPSRPLETLLAVDPNDVTLGEFKNYNLISTLSLLAEKPYSLARLLEKQKLNSNGFYYVRLFVDGVWQFVTIDDLLPAQRSGPSQDDRLKSLSKNAFGYQTELWVSLIEKAIAKVYGSYQDLELQQPSVSELLWILTGAPSYEIKEKSGVLGALEGTPLAIMELGDCDVQGLQTVYGYSVLGSDKSGVRLRNPWGWIGKTNVKGVGPEGEFSMSLTELGLYLRRMTVSHFREEYWSVSHSVKQAENSYSVFELQLEKQSHCFLSLCQLSEKFFRNNLTSKYDYEFARVLVFDRNNELVGAIGSKQQFTTVELTLDAGTYQVVCCVDSPYESTLSYYGSENCEIRRVSTTGRLNLFSLLMAKQCVKSGMKHTYPASNTNYSKNVTEYLFLDEQCKLIGVAWNNSSKDPQNYRRDLKQIQFKSILKPLTLVNPADEAKTTKLSTKVLKTLKEKSWSEGQYLELKLEGGQTHAVLFKTLDGRYEKDIFKQVGLL